MGPASRIGVGATPRRWLASSFASWEGLHGAPPRRSGVRSNQLECGEVGSIAGRVAGGGGGGKSRPRGRGRDGKGGKGAPPLPRRPADSAERPFPPGSQPRTARV